MEYIIFILLAILGIFLIAMAFQADEIAELKNELKWKALVINDLKKQINKK